MQFLLSMCRDGDVCNIFTNTKPYNFVIVFIGKQTSTNTRMIVLYDITVATKLGEKPRLKVLKNV